MALSLEFRFFAGIRKLRAEVLLLLHLLWQGSGKTEIANLDTALVSEEHIARLEVSVKDICGVEEVNCTEQVVQNDFGMLHVKRNVLIFIENLGQVLIDMAHHQENAFWVGLRVLVGLSRNDDVNKLDSEDIVFHLGEPAENSNFSVDSLDAVDRVEGIRNVFYRHGLLGRLGGSLDHLPEAALSLNSVQLVVTGDASPGSWQALQKVLRFVGLVDI